MTVNNNDNKNGDVNVQLGGEYVGSASNMARVFVLCNVIWAIIFAGFAYVQGYKIGNLENRLEILERIK